jgi:hypothetical protein
VSRLVELDWLSVFYPLFGYVEDQFLPNIMNQVMYSSASSNTHPGRREKLGKH